VPTNLAEVFNDPDLSKTKCILLSDSYEEALELEKISVSKFSPSTVKKDEFLARQVFSPIHVDLETGDITAAAFTDAFDKGLSVNRISYAGKEEIHLLGGNKAQLDSKTRPDRKYLGFVSTKVADIRECLEGSKRIFAIFDTALKEVPSHADLCVLLLNTNESLTPPLPKKASRKKRRLTLKKLFSNLTPPIKI